MLLELAGRDVELKKVSKNEWHGPCPICDGRDRFRVQPKRGKRGRFNCRQCGISGDPIDYLRIVKGLSFVDACIQLGVVPEKFSRKYDHGITDSWRHKSSQWDPPPVSHQNTPKPARVAIVGEDLPQKTPTSPAENPGKDPEIAESVEAKQDIPLVDEVAQEQTEETFEPVIDQEEVSTEINIAPVKRVALPITTTPENGWCAKGQTYCPDFAYNKRFRVEKCRFESKDPVGTTIDLLAQCPNSNILEGTINEKRDRELYGKDNSDNKTKLAGVQGDGNSHEVFYNPDLAENRRGYKNLLGIYCHAEDSGSGMKYQKNPSGPSFQLIMQNMIQFGCGDCKDRHGQVCAGGSYPRLIGLLEGCGKQ